MDKHNKLCARRATWLAFGLVALAVITSAHDADATKQDSLAQSVFNTPPTTTLSTTPDSAITTSTTDVATQSTNDAKLSQKEQDQIAEASRAYRQAMQTLHTLRAHNVQRPFDPALLFGINSNSRSLFSSLLPNFQGQGPIGSAVRIALRLHQYTLNTLTGLLTHEAIGLGSSKRKEEDLQKKAIKVMDLLQHSAELGNTDALFTLGHVSLFPPTPHFIHNPQQAFDTFSAHASQTGNATSQAYIGFFYATGYKNIVPVNQAKAQLYYTFAANGGDKGAQMTLGYRFWSGIGTSESCERALSWYGTAAERAMARFLSGPSGGRTLPQTPTRLSDLAGGIYGPGASVASTGQNTHRPAIKAGIARAAGETWEDVIEYYLFNADRGEVEFAYRLGRIFYQGSIYHTPGGIASGSEGVGTVPRNYKIARKYFHSIARKVWPYDPPNTTENKDERAPTGYAAAAAGYLGRMYLRGEGIKAPDPVTAKAWFDRGATYGDKESHNGLGIIYRDGLIPGSKPDMKQALFHFNAAAGQDLAEAQVNIGKYHYERGDLGLASTYFETAVRTGSTFEAYYYLAEIQAAQASTRGMPAAVVSSSCAMAVSFYKIVAERGVWDQDLLRDAEYDWMSGTDQGKELAMLKWWIAAEQGYEIAQNNLAYVLDQDKTILRSTRFSPIAPSNDTARLALTQWTRAAAQRNIDALVKVGDYYYHGLGVPDESEKSRLEKAARYYQSAADTQMSALAMWNLGWMYENGIGVPQDFYLAKRHYDLALETNSEAYLPVMLSLTKLYARSIWHTLMGGQGGLKLWGPEEEENTSKNKKPEHRQLEDGRQQEETQERAEDEEPFYRDDDDASWYIGKAKEDFHRRRGEQTRRRPTDDDEDPIQWARERREAERERDSDFGPEDYFDGAMRGGNREDMEFDEFGETIVLIALCLVISVLLYIRTRIIERMRRDQRQQQNGENNGQGRGGQNGLFPPPGDAARNDWAILR